MNKALVTQFLVVLCLMITSRANELVKSNLFFFFYIACCLLFFFLAKGKFTKRFSVFVVFVLLMFLENLIRFGLTLDFLRYLKLFFLILCSYQFILITGASFYSYFCKWTLISIKFSLVFYFWQLVSVGSLHNLGLKFHNTLPFLSDLNEHSLNVFFYTIEFLEYFRNSGFMWEPGAFASIIVLAFYFHIQLNNFTWNREYFWYIIGILSTFSTTGYILLLLLLYFFYRNYLSLASVHSKVFSFLVTPIVVFLSVIVFFETDFMYEKIFEQYVSQSQVADNLNDYLKFRENTSVGRFGALILDLQSVKDNFLFGRGYGDGFFRVEYEDINMPNGFSNFVGRFGFIGFLWLMIVLFQTELRVQDFLHDRLKSRIFFPAIMLIILFSNPILFTPLFIGILMIPYLPKKSTYSTANA
jgi:hypothetical protein